MVFADDVSLSTCCTYDGKRKTIFYAKTDVSDLGPLCANLKQTRAEALAHYHPHVLSLCNEFLKFHDTAIHPMNTGTFRLLYRIQSPYQAPMIMRLNRIPEYGTAWDFILDTWVYRLLAERGLAVPRVIKVDISRHYFPTDYQLLTFIPGETLKSFEDEQTQAMVPRLLQSIGAYLGKVHSIALSGYGPLSLYSVVADKHVPRGIHTTWYDYILLRLDEHVAVCRKINALTTQEAHHILDLFHSHADFFKGAPSVLLHGDVGNQNFISDDGIRIAALVDWEDSMSGDPVFEIAFWGTFFRDCMLEHFLAGYTSVSSLPVDFAYRYWLYYLRIALSKTVHRFRFGYGDRADRPPAALRIQKALDHIKSIKTF
jgi:aminoglycoside phosphotransferase (APT) family kinase protein